MATQVNPPRGMRDILPADKARRERALGIIRAVYRKHGFDEIETPALEDHGVLHSGLGGDNEKLSYEVLRRGLTGDDLSAAAERGSAAELVDLGLRFDLTVPLARFYASHRAELPGVFRAVQVAPVWRAERPQKGRYRQFLQCDIDIIGEPGLIAEAELITATAETLGELGLTDCVIRVNDRRILNGLLDAAGFDAAHRAQALISIDKLDKIGVEGVLTELRERGEASADRFGEALRAFAPVVEAGGVPLTESAIRELVPAGDPEVDEAILSLTALADALEGLRGAEVRFDPTLVRGMGYYTGTIFEIAHPASGHSVGGGGRYDGMIGRFLGQDVPACGFSIGFDRVVDLASVSAGDDEDARVLLYDRDASPATLMPLKRAAAEAFDRVRLEPRARNLKNQLAQLAEAGFRSFAFVDEPEAGLTALSWRDLEAS